MTLTYEINTAIKKALGNITYQNDPVPYYDMVRDDGAQVHIYNARISSEYDGNKTKDLYQVTVHLVVRHFFSPGISGTDVVDEVGAQLEEAMKTNLTLDSWNVVVQYLDSTFCTQNSRKAGNEVIKAYIYRMIIEEK